MHSISHEIELDRCAKIEHLGIDLDKIRCLAKVGNDVYNHIT